MNIRIIFKPSQRKSERSGLTVAPTRAVELRTVPTDILHSALVDFSSKERISTKSGVSLSKCDDSLPESMLYISSKSRWLDLGVPLDQPQRFCELVTMIQRAQPKLEHQPQLRCG